jgi:hypothetical protein
MFDVEEPCSAIPTLDVPAGLLFLRFMLLYKLCTSDLRQCLGCPWTAEVDPKIIVRKHDEEKVAPSTTFYPNRKIHYPQ